MSDEGLRHLIEQRRYASDTDSHIAYVLACEVLKLRASIEAAASSGDAELVRHIKMAVQDDRPAWWGNEEAVSLSRLRIANICDEILESRSSSGTGGEPAYRVDGCQVVVGESKPLAKDFLPSDQSRSPVSIAPSGLEAEPGFQMTYADAAKAGRAAEAMMPNAPPSIAPSGMTTEPTFQVLRDLVRTFVELDLPHGTIHQYDVVALRDLLREVDRLRALAPSGEPTRELVVLREFHDLFAPLTYRGLLNMQQQTAWMDARDERARSPVSIAPGGEPVAWAIKDKDGDIWHLRGSEPSTAYLAALGQEEPGLAPYSSVPLYSGRAGGEGNNG